MKSIQEEKKYMYHHTKIFFTKIKIKISEYINILQKKLVVFEKRKRRQL